MIYIFWACRDRDEAKRIVHLLLEARLIACGSVLPEVVSIYRWQGNVEEASETKVILKTRLELFESVRSLICGKCSYEVPEIAAVEVARCNPEYQAWLDGQ